MTLEELYAWSQENHLSVQLTICEASDKRYNVLFLDVMSRLPSDKLKGMRMLRASVSFEDDIINVSQVLEHCHKIVSQDLITARSKNADSIKTDSSSQEEISTKKEDR